VGTQVSICKSCLTLLSKIHSLVRMYRAAGLSKFWWGRMWIFCFYVLSKYFCQKWGCICNPCTPSPSGPAVVHMTSGLYKSCRLISHCSGDVALRPISPFKNEDSLSLFCSSGPLFLCSR
jgi:hypothetical protein